MKPVGTACDRSGRAHGALALWCALFLLVAQAGWSAGAPPPAYVPEECRARAVGGAARATASQSTAAASARHAPLSRTQQMDVYQRLVDAVSSTYVHPDFNGLGWSRQVAAARARIS